MYFIQVLGISGDFACIRFFYHSPLIPRWGCGSVWPFQWQMSERSDGEATGRYSPSEGVLLLACLCTISAVASASIVCGCSPAKVRRRLKSPETRNQNVLYHYPATLHRSMFFQVFNLFTKRRNDGHSFFPHQKLATTKNNLRIIFFIYIVY